MNKGRNYENKVKIVEIENNENKLLLDEENSKTRNSTEKNNIVSYEKKQKNRPLYIRGIVSDFFFFFVEIIHVSRKSPVLLQSVCLFSRQFSVDRNYYYHCDAAAPSRKRQALGTLYYT